jgi:predicted RNA-binding protein with RPS1 domain
MAKNNEWPKTTVADLVDETTHYAANTERTAIKQRGNKIMGNLRNTPKDSGDGGSFDPTAIRVRRDNLSLESLINRLQNNALDLSPSFQRKPNIWSEGAQSRLIESLLLLIPIPAFYFDARDERKWLVIDGVQRLTAISRFVMDEDILSNPDLELSKLKLSNLKLSNLEILTELNNKTFKNLEYFIVRRILDTQVIAYLIEPGTPENVKYNIFQRLNIGVALPLSEQEIRNAFPGQATEILKDLAESVEFLKATNRRIKGNRREDQECVLRFIAFTLSPYAEYENQNFDRFLRDTMACLNQMSKKKWDELKETFKKAMEAAHKIFGDAAFGRADDQRYDDTIDQALFEVWSVHLGQLSDDDRTALIKAKKYVTRDFRQLLSDKTFRTALTSPKSADVKNRFEKVEQFIQKSLQKEALWANIDGTYPRDNIVSGKVVRIRNTRAFVEFKDGIEGMIPDSELSWTELYPNPSELFKAGDVVDVKVLGIDSEARRISLSYKQAKPDPLQKYSIGSVVRGKVVRIGNTRAVVELAGGIVGLIPESELSWTELHPNPSEFFSEGDLVDVVVLKIDRKKRRIELSYKRIEPDPWESVPEKYNVGSVVRGKIVKIRHYGAFAELEDNLNGFIHLSELAPGYIERVEDVVSVGDKLDLKVIYLNMNERKINLSLKDVHNEQQHRRQRHPPRNKSDDHPTLLGDLLREELNRAASKKVNEPPPTGQKSEGGT